MKVILCCRWLAVVVHHAVAGDIIFPEASSDSEVNSGHRSIHISYLNFSVCTYLAIKFSI